MRIADCQYYSAKFSCIVNAATDFYGAPTAGATPFEKAYLQQKQNVTAVTFCHSVKIGCLPLTQTAMNGIIIGVFS